MRSKPIMREIKVSKHKFRLEIYPEDYHAALYAFSNKEKLNKIIEDKHIYEPKKTKSS